VNDDQTRLLNQTLALGGNPDDVQIAEQYGHTLIIHGTVTIAVSLSSQAALDKLATVTAQAAANNRARRLREVA
jgi:galactokinase